MCVTRDRTPCPVPNCLSVVGPGSSEVPVHPYSFAFPGLRLRVTFSLNHRECWVGFLVRSDALLELLVPLGDVAARLVLGHQNLTLAHALEGNLGKDAEHCVGIRNRISVLGQFPTMWVCVLIVYLRSPTR